MTGTFDDWSKSEKLVKTGDIFQKDVTLSSADEKIYYKVRTRLQDLAALRLLWADSGHKFTWRWRSGRNTYICFGQSCSSLWNVGRLHLRTQLGLARKSPRMRPRPC